MNSCSCNDGDRELPDLDRMVAVPFAAVGMDIFADMPRLLHVERIIRSKRSIIGCEMLYVQSRTSSNWSV